MHHAARIGFHHAGRMTRGAVAAIALVGAAGTGCASASGGPRPGAGARPDPAIALLDALRRDAPAPRPATFRGEEVACFLEDRAAHPDPAAVPAFDAWRDARRAEPSAGAADASGADRTLARLQARVERTLAERGASLGGQRVVFGTAATGTAVPRVLAVAAGARLVVLDDRLLDMVYAVVSAAFDAQPDRDARSCARGPEARATRAGALARPRFAISMRHFVGAAASARYDLAPAEAAPILAAVRTAELFAVAHEYAHALLRHPPARAPAAGAAELSYGTDQEVAADALAFALVQETVRRDGSDAEKEMAPFAPEVMLHVIHLLETARAVYAGAVPAAAPGALEAQLWPPGAGLAGESPLAIRRAALRGRASALVAAGGGATWDASAFIGRATACLFGTVAEGLASAGERRREALATCAGGEPPASITRR